MAYELTNLPSPSAFSSSSSPPISPMKKSKPDLSIDTSMSSPSLKPSGDQDVELEGKGQAHPIPHSSDRRRSAREHISRTRHNIAMSRRGNNPQERGYSHIPSNESEYTTPTTLGSLDYDTTSPSCSHIHYHPSQTRHQKNVSKMRLRVLYTLIPVVSIALFALYTLIIIDHAQKNMLTKVQYPGTSSQQAQAQIASGTSQGVLGAISGSTSTENIGGEKEEDEKEVNQDLEQGLGPLKTGTDTNIGDVVNEDKPQGWKGVDILSSEHNGGPTILVPTGVSITITDETPAPQVIPPPPPKYVTPAAAPEKSQEPTSQPKPVTIPTSSLTIPGHPYPLSCGPTPEAARAKNCIFDIMSYAWLPPPCYDHNLTTAFITSKSRSISLTGKGGKHKSSTGEGNGKVKVNGGGGGQTLSTGWRYYQNWSDKTPLDSSVVERGDVESVYVTWEWHLEHCLFMWRKMHRSLLVYGGGGDVVGQDVAGSSMGGVASGGEGEDGPVLLGKEMMIDGYMGDYEHTLKCGESLRTGGGIDLDAVNTMIRMKFPTCGLWTGG